MKICFLAAGELPIPPNGWGALETVLWSQYSALKSLGIDVHFVNEKNPLVALEKIGEIDPDIVHLHYGGHYQIMPHINKRKIVTCHDGSYRYSTQFHDKVIRECLYDCEFFCLTDFERDFILQIGLPPWRVHILPNGVEIDSFKFDPIAFKETICLGKIDKRKQQAMLQSMDLGIFFAGEIAGNDFSSIDPHYLGIWTQEQVRNNLTKYANLILLSMSELQPLVCLEALAAGLGLVISEACVQSLDINKPFIDIIPSDKINNKAYISNVIQKNTDYSLNHRNEIRNYAKEFDWSEIVKKYLQLL